MYGTTQVSFFSHKKVLVLSLHNVPQYVCSECITPFFYLHRLKTIPTHHFLYLQLSIVILKIKIFTIQYDNTRHTIDDGIRVQI